MSADPARPRFLLVPSIDLLAGRVVRLRQGDAALATEYPGSAAGHALRWVRLGADLLHIVDLDGALGATGVNARVVHDIIGRTASWSGAPEARADPRADVDGGARPGVVPGRHGGAAAPSAFQGCEVAGGIRDRDAVRSWLGRGAARVVLGTALLARPGLASELIAEHGSGRIVAALDVRDGMAVGDGWRADARRAGLDQVLGELVEAGVTGVEVTAIARDGAMSGPDLELLAQARRLAPGARILASGGVRSVTDLLAIRGAGCDGAIVGRALYEGRFSLSEARDVLDSRPA